MAPGSASAPPPAISPSTKTHAVASEIPAVDGSRLMLEPTPLEEVDSWFANVKWRSVLIVILGKVRFCFIYCCGNEFRNNPLFFLSIKYIHHSQMETMRVAELLQWTNNVTQFYHHCAPISCNTHNISFGVDSKLQELSTNDIFALFRGKTPDIRVKPRFHTLALTITSLVPEEPSRSAEQVPERPSTGSQPGEELSPKKGIIENSSLEFSMEYRTHASPPAREAHGTLAAARGDVTAPPTAASSSENLADPASLNWADSEMAEVDANDDYTVVKSKKRRLSSTPEQAAKQASRPAEKRGPQQQKRTTGPRSMPPQEIKATRANIADARARQANTNHENYVFVELCPDIPDYSYLRAIGDLVGGPKNIAHFGRMNGHYIVGLASKNLASRLVEEGLNIEGTLLKVFLFRKRAERIIVANLPGFVEDATIVQALREYGDITSIAPIMIKMGEFAFSDGRREAFILLREGVRLETLPTRLTIHSKGDTLSAFLSFGIKCSKCGKQGHRRANCPALARQGNGSPRQAASPTDARPPLPPPQRPRKPAPAPATPASPVQPAKTSAEAQAIPSAHQHAEQIDLTHPAPAAHPAPLAALRPPEPRIPPLDQEMSAALEQLLEHLGKSPNPSIDWDKLPNLNCEEAQKLLTSETTMKRRAPTLTEEQFTALEKLHETIKALCPDSNSTIRKTLQKTRKETNAFHPGSGQDLCLGYSAVVLAHPVAISGSGLACVFGPGVAVLQQRILWPGHIALATIDVHGEEMTAIAVHLAHEPRERNRQLELLAATAAQEEEGACWIIGDFNIRVWGPSSSSSSDALAALLDLAALVDVATQFDAAHLPTRVSMHGDQVESNRLDRILVPAGVLDRVSIYATSHYHLSDHRLVLLQVGPPTTAVSSPTQPRLAAMLRSGLALEHLAGYIRELEEDTAHDDDDRTFWDRWTSIKAGLLAEARSLHDPRHAANDSYVYRARRYIAAQLEASSIRADYPSLPDLARAIRLRRPVSVIRDEQDNIIEGPELRRRAFATFQPRFSRPTSDPAAGAAFIASSAPTTTRELSEEDQLHLPDISPSEIANAIEHLPRGKAPGWDGLPCELLVAFSEDFFAEALARVFAASRLRGALPPSTRRSSICLVPKARGGRGLDGYRPVALPSADYRVLAAILHRRLKPHLRTLVPECQTYAVPGRSPSWNIAMVTDAIEEATALGSPLAVMGVDLESAFDSLDRGFLESLLTSLRLPPAFMAWINILYAGADATIRVGGFHTTAFPLLNGLRQGCALTLGVGNVIAYADEIVLLFHRDGDFERVATVFEDYRQASGIGVNLGKSAGLWCGAWRNRGDSPLGASWSTTSIRVLGVDIAPRSTVIHREQHLLALLETACRKWTPFTRGLSLVGTTRRGFPPMSWRGQLPSEASASSTSRPSSGGRNAFSWLVGGNSGEAWIHPPPDGTRLRLLKLWEEASNILGLNHRAVPTAQLLDLPIIGGCRFLRPPDLLAPARWRGARVRDLIVEENLIARPSRSALADAATLGAFCRRLTSENAVGFGAESTPSSSSLAAAVVLRGTATPFLNGLTTRSARRALDRPRLAATPISRFLARWTPTINPPSRIDWASLRHCAYSGHEADAALKLALHTLPHPAHPASVGPSCPACGSIDRSLSHRYWCCPSIRPLIREAFNIIGRPPDLQAWIFGGSGLEDDALSILASAKLRIYRCFVQVGLGEAVEDPLIAWSRTLQRRGLLPLSLLPSILLQTGEELSPKEGNMKKTIDISSENQKYANSPAGDLHVNPAAARGDVTAPKTAATTSATSASPASLNWADSEMAEVNDNEGFIVVKAKKRRLGSTSPEHAARQPNKPGEQRSSQQRKRPTGPRAVPPQEIKATRKNIAEAKARQNSSTHENYIFVERCPEFPDYTYLKAISKLVGGPNDITYFGKMNGHFLVGLATKDLALRLAEGDLEIEGTTLRVFPYRKRAERIVVANLPGFVDDFTVVNALSPYGRVTSIAPILIKMGEFTFTDGRREAFILLKDGIKLDRLPTRLDIQSKGDSLPAFLSFGIKCSKCGKQGHRRANCPSLARQNSSPRQAASPTDARPPPPSPPPPQQPRRPTPAPATSASPVQPAKSSTEAPVTPSAHHPAEPRDLAQPAPVALPAPLAAPRPPEPETFPLDIEMSEEELTSTPSASPRGKPAFVQLEEHLKQFPNLSIDWDGLPGIDREDAQRLLTSKGKMEKRAPSLSKAQVAALDQETNAFHLGSGQDLCLGYSAVILAHPVAISRSGLACVFGPGVAVLRQRILWPGHIALATIDVRGEEMTAIAVHLAHEPRERNRQLELLAATAAQEEEGACWIIGDFNIRDRGPSSSSSSDALAALLDLAALVDVATQFDAAHLPTRVAMHGDQVESNRLDRILVPAGVLDRVSIYATSHYHLSDHRLVLLQVGPPTSAVSSPTQPRLAAMLRSGLVLEHLAGYIRELEEDTAHDDDDGILWDRWTTIKAGLLAEARSLHDPRHAASDSYVYRARRYIAAQLEASSIRADYPSLPDLARAIRLRRPVSVIRDEQDNIIEGPELRRRAFATFQPRFARPTSDPAAGAAFIASSAPTTTRELTPPSRKAPGWDGLPCELLVAFSEDFFAEALARVFAASRLRGALPPSTRRSSICLVPKARGGRGLNGYRPVALPSADYRVLAAILHRRLKPHLRTLVPECQTYAVPGRSPSWNIAMVTDAVEEATALGSPLAVMGVDLESAFDSLDRGFLESLLISLRLPPAFLAWINILYAGADATIRAGGFYTTAFPLLNGLRQGCAVSAALFSIATGPLLRRLELTLGVGNVTAYADDIVLLFHRDEDFERVATVFEDYKQASGVGVNLRKSAGLWCGAWRNRGDSPLGASWSTTSIRVLGLDIAPRSTVIHREQHLLALLETACRKWTPFTRGLSLVGRARAANTLVGSTIQHHLHGYLPSPPTIAKLQARLARFVWGPDHTAWLPANVMARPVTIGGLGLHDLATQLQLACLKGVQVALRGGRNAFSWLVESGEAWIHPPPDGTRLQPRRLRLLKLWEEASNILSLNHRALPTAQLLDLPIIGGCRFLRPPDLLAPARWSGSRVRDLIEEENLIARPTRSVLADATALGAFCRRLTSENAVGFGAESTPSSSSLAAAVVLRGTATPFLNGLTTRSARRALDRPRLAATPISRFLARWTPTINPPSRIDWASLRRCAYSGHEADAALKLALHALPHPAHPASVGPSCPACGSIDRSLGHRYWCCRSIRPLIREAFNIIGRPPDLQAWIFGGSGLEDDALSILASAKLRIYRYFVQVELGEAVEDPLIAWSRTLQRRGLLPLSLL
ncbi:hypothetical protein LAZ67_23000742 [Cordylochernes scorpioides]|uniref:Uncharacterized protein n=1 Tax=Cordylochernes scorpioides TaxID=51811 RepID=A0ABY6LQ55_9ARAC|nr:hypothetical protein LAZ67_23000742 [Cordylochernes scorpioides]